MTPHKLTILLVAYNHHFESTLTGNKSVMERVLLSPEEQVCFLELWWFPSGFIGFSVGR
jgi:hypothetical protein